MTPEVRQHFAAIAATSERWRNIIANWDTLEASLKTHGKTYEILKGLNP